ncbi:hypothetical protein [Helicobacter pylori]|uniref:hypothetical protein n=1 Tax=Helicobacter pylori TaxID=210 RepID=UPI003CC844B6
MSEEDKIKFKQALRVLHAIVSNEAYLRYLSDENQKFIENLAQAEKITNELVEKTLEIVSYSDVDVDFEAFEKVMLNVDEIAVGLKSYSQSQLLDLDGGHWDLEVPSSSKESVTFFLRRECEQIGAGQTSVGKRQRKTAQSLQTNGF